MINVIYITVLDFITPTIKKFASALLLFLMFIYSEREREREKAHAHMNGGGAEGEGERENPKQAPNMGLNPTNHKIMT